MFLIICPDGLHFIEMASSQLLQPLFPIERISIVLNDASGRVCRISLRTVTSILFHHLPGKLLLICHVFYVFFRLDIIRINGYSRLVGMYLLWLIWFPLLWFFFDFVKIVIIYICLHVFKSEHY